MVKVYNDEEGEPVEYKTGPQVVGYESCSDAIRIYSLQSAGLYVIIDYVRNDVGV